MDEISQAGTLELAELIRSGAVSAVEAVGASLARIEELESRVNAFTHVSAEEVLATAAGLRRDDPRPFAGVPIAIKDNRGVVGMPLSYGSAIFADNRAQEDAYFVRRLRDAGFVMLGKTALPEGGILPTCESAANGPTANPWDLSRTPGGSSGGAAAAVAAGMLSVAHGNDGGGSLRIPAACCGLVGLKPARGRVSTGPVSGHSFLVSDGVITRTVADTAALLDVLCGYELGDATWAPAPASTYLGAARTPPPTLRIALVTRPPLEDAEVDPECLRGARAAVVLLESLGHEIVEFQPPWSGTDLDGDFTAVFGAGAGMLVHSARALLGREPGADEFEPLTWALYERASAQSTLEYLAALGRLEVFARELVAAFAAFDVVLTPALAQRPLPTGAVHGRGPDPWDHFHRSGLFTPFTAVINVTGLPAMSLPVQLGPDGLPTAVQLIGRPAGEAQLLALGAQLERACGWGARRPAVAGADSVS